MYLAYGVKHSVIEGDRKMLQVSCSCQRAEVDHSVTLKNKLR